MGRSQESFSKKEKEKKRRKKNQEKKERRELRKALKAEQGTKTFEDMLSYVDENGNLTSTPPDPTKRRKIKAEDIVLGVPPNEHTPMDNVRHGMIKFFSPDKGYGFITEDHTKDSIFVHVNNVQGTIKETDRVSYEVEMGPKGPNAVNVKIETGEEAGE